MRALAVFKSEASVMRAPDSTFVAPARAVSKPSWRIGVRWSSGSCAMNSDKTCISRAVMRTRKLEATACWSLVHKIALDGGLIARSRRRGDSEGQDCFDDPTPCRAPVQQPRNFIRRGRRQRGQCLHVVDAAEQFRGGRFEKSGRAPALAGSARCVRSSLAASTALVARAAPSVNEVCASAGETSAAIKSKALIAATQASLVLRQARWLPLFRSGKGITESRQILLHLVIVGRFF